MHEPSPDVAHRPELVGSVPLGRRAASGGCSAAEDRHAGDRQVAAEVRLRQHADGVAAAVGSQRRDEVPMPPFHP